MIIIYNQPNDKIIFIRFTHTTVPVVTKQTRGVKFHVEWG